MAASRLLTVGWLALAGTCRAQLQLNAFPVDLTIALLDGSTGCDTSNAPTLHVTGMRNGTNVVITPDLWLSNSTEAAREAMLNGTTSSSFNYTLSNTQNFDPNASYTGIYYQQLSGNTTEDQAGNTLGLLRVSTFPCDTGSSDCRGVSGEYFDGPDAATRQWSCYAAGTCYQTGYSIRSLSFGAVQTGISNATSAEQDDRCELATWHFENATRNNNTDMQGAGNSVRARGSMAGLLSTVAVVLGLMMWT